MNKQIRQSVFETNSSSTHSISISPDSKGIYETIVPDDNGVIVLTGGQYGRVWEKYNDPLTKANYCAVDVFKQEDSKDMLKKVIIEHTGAKDVIFGFTTEYENGNLEYSYIDHDSEGCTCSAFESEQTLKNFLFNPESWLYLSEDNGVQPPNFYDHPDTVYKYVLKVEGTDLVEKFVEYPTRSKMVTDNSYGEGYTHEIDELKEALYRILSRHPQERYSNNYLPYDYDLEKWRDKEFNSYELCYYDRHNVNSFSNIEKGYVTLYRFKTGYGKDQTIVSSKLDLKYSIDEI